MIQLYRMYTDSMPLCAFFCTIFRKIINIKEKQLENLMNLVEKHTRTERHLEQYSEIGDEKYKEQAREKQDIREQEMQNLKNKIVNDNETTKEQAKNLIDNYNKTQKYINNNLENLTDEKFKNMENNQENRIDQMENITKNLKNKYRPIREQAPRKEFFQNQSQLFDNNPLLENQTFRNIHITLYVDVLMYINQINYL